VSVLTLLPMMSNITVLPFYVLLVPINPMSATWYVHRRIRGKLTRNSVLGVLAVVLAS